MGRKQQNVNVSHLTPREREIFIGVARGLTSRQIGQQYGISFRTVDVHRTSIRLKTGLPAGPRRHPWHAIADRAGWLTEPKPPAIQHHVAPRPPRQFDSNGEPIDPLVERLCEKWQPYALNL